MYVGLSGLGQDVKCNVKLSVLFMMKTILTVSGKCGECRDLCTWIMRTLQLVIQDLIRKIIEINRVRRLDMFLKIYFQLYKNHCVLFIDKAFSDKI